MSLTEFKQPEWLDGITTRGIEEKMMANLPLDIDKTEGGFAWDLTYPTAIEKAEMLQYYMVMALKTMFPQWAEGRWLDYHAHDNGLVRRAANHAYGYVTVTGKVGRVIPQGFVFSVPSVDGSAAIDFETLSACSIPESGSIDIAVQAVEAGTVGNVANDTITIMRSPIVGITNITNKEAITGGAEAESDDSLRQRIDDLLAGRGDSFVGNNADYVRWAKEVPGVGFAHTIPEYNGPNSVKVVIVDANGVPANEQILEAVKLHIFGTNRCAYHVQFPAEARRRRNGRKCQGSVQDRALGILCEHRVRQREGQARAVHRDVRRACEEHAGRCGLREVPHERRCGKHHIRGRRVPCDGRNRGDDV